MTTTTIELPIEEIQQSILFIRENLEITICDLNLEAAADIWRITNKHVLALHQ